MRSSSRRLTVVESSSPPKSERGRLAVMEAFPVVAAGPPPLIGGCLRRRSAGGVSQVEPAPGLLRSGDVPVQQPRNGGDPLDLRGVGLGQLAGAVPQRVLEPDPG